MSNLTRLASNDEQEELLREFEGRLEGTELRIHGARAIGKQPQTVVFDLMKKVDGKLMVAPIIVTAGDDVYGARLYGETYDENSHQVKNISVYDPEAYFQKNAEPLYP